MYIGRCIIRVTLPRPSRDSTASGEEGRLTVYSFSFFPRDFSPPPAPFLSSFLADIRRGRASRHRDDEGSRTAGARPSFKTRGWPVRVPMFCVLFTILLVFFYFVWTPQTSRYRSRNRVSRGKGKGAGQTIANRPRAERVACPAYFSRSYGKEKAEETILVAVKLEPEGPSKFDGPLCGPSPSFFFNYFLLCFFF